MPSGRVVFNSIQLGTHDTVMHAMFKVRSRLKQVAG